MNREVLKTSNMVEGGLGLYSGFVVIKKAHNSRDYICSVASYKDDSSYMMQQLTSAGLEYYTLPRVEIDSDVILMLDYRD